MAKEVKTVCRWCDGDKCHFCGFNGWILVTK